MNKNKASCNTSTSVVCWENKTCTHTHNTAEIELHDIRVVRGEPLARAKRALGT